jgi:ACS family tartrate transporter-like MFS transporter
VLGVPFSQALGAWVTGEILKVNWLGLAGWQWVFLLEGAPALLLGVAVLFLLTDRPRQARWLTAAERDWLEQTLEAERREAEAGGRVTLAQALRRPAVWLLALGILATNTGGYGLGYWLPTVVKELLRQTGVGAAGHSAGVAASAVGGLAAPAGQPWGALGAVAAAEARDTVSDSEVLLWLVPFYAAGLLGVWVVGRSSDRTGDRKWHCVAGQVLTGVFLAASVAPGQPWGWVMGWLCLAGFFAYFWPPPFWVLPTQALSASAAAVAIGFINICANVAGIIGPPVVGQMKTAGLGDRACVLTLAACYVAGGAIVAALRTTGARGPSSLQESGR